MKRFRETNFDTVARVFAWLVAGYLFVWLIGTNGVRESIYMFLLNP